MTHVSADAPGSLHITRSLGQQIDESRVGASLDDLPLAWIDRLLPRHPKAFAGVVVGVAGGVWLLAWGVASNRSVFLMSKEWQIQPLFLAGHLVTLRLFVTCYTRNYLKGAQYLDMPTASATKWVLNVLGPWGGVAALALAAPFCFFDIASLKEYCLVPDAGVGMVDVIQAGVWCVEWAINAYIWVILVGFALLLTWTVGNQVFRDPLQTVIQLKQYRPFLLMSVQGSTTIGFLRGVVRAICVVRRWRHLGFHRPGSDDDTAVGMLRAPVVIATTAIGKRVEAAARGTVAATAFCSGRL
jgi:hypothetical protein